MLIKLESTSILAPSTNEPKNETLVWHTAYLVATKTTIEWAYPWSETVIV